MAQAISTLGASPTPELLVESTLTTTARTDLCGTEMELSLRSIRMEVLTRPSLASIPREQSRGHTGATPPITDLFVRKMTLLRIFKFSDPTRSRRELTTSGQLQECTSTATLGFRAATRAQPM